jgi:hypothetical protein
MPDTYRIYLVNNSADPQNFWCFLAPPQELSNNPGVFANSSTSIEVAPNYAGVNMFVIPVQYVVGVGASNQAVGLNIEIISQVQNDASLTDTWNANYVNAPPNQGPTMALAGTRQNPNGIAIVTNHFNKSSNEQNGWYSNQTFGIETEVGFIGMTWSPDPGQTTILTPRLNFYIALGPHGSNRLANYDEFSNDSAVVDAPSSFDQLNECTVTYTQAGEWQIRPGKPAILAVSQDLAFFRSPQHQDLAALAQLDSGSVTADTLVSVHWDRSLEGVDPADITFLTGTITVAVALGAAFSFFILSGLRFDIKGSTRGATTVQFSYSGPQSAPAVKNLFVAGAHLVFGGSR